MLETKDSEVQDAYVMTTEQKVEEMSREEVQQYYDIFGLAKKYYMDPEELTDAFIRGISGDRFSPFSETKSYFEEEWIVLMTERYGDEWKSWSNEASEEDSQKEIQAGIIWEDISLIRVTDGSQVEITDEDMLKEFLEKIEAIQFMEEEEASTVNQSIGYQYMLKLLDGQGAVVHTLLLQGDVVVMDKVPYKTAGTEELTAYIAKLY